MIIKKMVRSGPPKELVKATQVVMLTLALSSIFPRLRQLLPSPEEGMATLVLVCVSYRGLGKHAGALLWSLWGLLSWKR